MTAEAGAGRWITISGARIFLKEGQSVGDALAEKRGASGPSGLTHDGSVRAVSDKAKALGSKANKVPTDAQAQEAAASAHREAATAQAKSGNRTMAESHERSATHHENMAKGARELAATKQRTAEYSKELSAVKRKISAVEAPEIKALQKESRDLKMRIKRVNQETRLILREAKRED